MELNLDLLQSNRSFSTLENENSRKVEHRTYHKDEISDEKTQEREKKTIHIESSIMDWFKERGVTSGNPSGILEEQQELKLKGIVARKGITLEKTSSLLGRRLKTKLTLA